MMIPDFEALTPRTVAEALAGKSAVQLCISEHVPLDLWFPFEGIVYVHPETLRVAIERGDLIAESPGQDDEARG